MAKEMWVSSATPVAFSFNWNSPLWPVQRHFTFYELLKWTLTIDQCFFFYSECDFFNLLFVTRYMGLICTFDLLEFEIYWFKAWILFFEEVHLFWLIVVSSASFCRLQASWTFENTYSLHSFILESWKKQVTCCFMLLSGAQL